MTKHRQIIRIATSAIAIGVLVAVIIPVLIFVFGVGLGISDAKATSDQNLLDEANKGLTLPVCTVATSCKDLFSFENKTVIEKIIENTTDGLQPPVIPPVIVEPPQSPEQITIELNSKVIKTDNTGKITEVKTIKPLTFLSFFVEDTSNIDYDNGFLENFISLKTKPNIPITGTAKFDVIIGEQSIFQNPISLSVDGVTDSNGEIIFDYKSGFGAGSNSFLFQFKDNISKFNPEGLTTLSFNIKDVSVEANNQKFVLANSTLFSMDIARDPNQLLITNENGFISRVYPTDDSLTITSNTGSYSWQKYECTYLYKGVSCYQMGYRTYSYCLEAPAMGGGTVNHIKKDGSVDLTVTFLANSQGGGTGSQSCPQIPIKLDLKLQRNEIYKINFNSPAGSVMLKTPKDRASNYVFYCINSGSSGALTTYCNYNDQSVIDSLKATLVN